MNKKTVAAALALAALAAVGCGDGGSDSVVGGASADAAMKASPLTLSPVATVTDVADLPALATATADLTGDGKADLAVLKAPMTSSQGSVAIVDVFPGPVTADDPLPSETYLLMPAARDLAAADMNQDGTLDLVAAIGANMSAVPPTSGLIHLMIRKPSGGLAWEDFVLTGLDAVRVRVADVDGDGRADILAEGGDGRITLARNLGAGAFSPGLRAGNGRGLLAADFDGDDAADLAFISAADSRSIEIRRWANGAMSPAATLVLDEDAHAICSGDFDGDGRTDLAAATDEGLRVANGAGAFAFGVPHQAGTGWTLQVAAGDIDGDGRADIGRCGFQNGYEIQAIFREGAGYAASLARSLASSLHRIEVADVTGDGKADLILASDRVTIYACD